jgi:hypothetical protein
MLGNIGLESFFKRFTFGPLMIDFYPLKREISDIGGFFVGKDEFIKPIQICGKKRKKRQNACDRNVSIISLSALVHCKKFGVKRPSVNNSWRVDFTGCESVKWSITDTEEGERFMLLFEEFCTNERIFSSSEEKQSVFSSYCELLGLTCSRFTGDWSDSEAIQ